jgi:hypothetical protein
VVGVCRKKDTEETIVDAGSMFAAAEEVHSLIYLRETVCPAY